MNEVVTGQYDPLDAIIADYLQALEAGQEPERSAYVAQHPEFADRLRAFFRDFDAMGRDASKFRLPASQANNETLSLGEAVPVNAPRIRYLGDYELLHEIARGGMGVVYRAKQVSLNRVVAIKMILAGTYASEQAVQRFRAEAMAAANLDHPNILPIYEVGEHEGHQYFSMKFVEGGSFASALGHVAPAQAIAWLTLLAHAVHYAHQRGILHRDLKPANVLLDRDGTPYITDFGLAKNVEADDGSTRTGTIVGTPSYMAPEQARGEKGLTTAVDVYSLGAILYEILTGRPPFKGETVFDTLQQVITCEPVDPLAVNATADRDLAIIALKCLQKDAARRYPSALALAEDLERWQRGEPIMARPITRRERATKWVKRNRLVAGLSAAILFALLAGLVASTIFAWQAKQALKQANINLVRAENGEATAQQRANEALAAQQAEAKSLHAEKWATYYARINLACNEWRLNNPARVQALLDECEPALRGWEWNYLQRLLRSEKACMLADPNTISVLAFSHDSSRVLTGGRDCRVRVWDAHTGAVRAQFRGHDGAVRSAVFTADGKHIVSATRRELFVWEATTGQLVSRGSLPDKGVRYLASSIRDQIAVTTAHDTVRVYASQDWKLLYEVAGTYAAYAPDGQTLVTLTQGNVVLRQATDGQEQHTFAGQGRNYFRVFLAGGKIAARGDDRGHWLTTVWDMASKKELCAIRGDGLALSADGATVAAGEERQVIFFDATTGRETHRLGALNGRMNAIQFSPDGLTMATGGGHLLTSDSLNASESDSDAAELLRALVGGAWRATPAAELRLWHRIPGREARTIADGGFYSTALSSKNIVALGREQTITLHDLSGRPLGTLHGHQQKVEFLSFTPDGSLLVSASADRTIRVWNVAQGKEVGRGPVGDSSVKALTVLNDQRTVATTFDQKVTRYWDIHTGQDVAVSFGTVEGADHLVAMPKPTQLLRSTSGSLNYFGAKMHVSAGQVTLIDAGDGRVLRTFAPTAGIVQRAVRSPNGKELALLIHHPEAKESIVQFMDTSTGQETRRLKGYSEVIQCLAFSPDGQRIAVGAEQTTKLLDAQTGSLILSVPRPTTWLEFPADGRSLVGVSDHQVVVFDSDPPPAVQPLPHPIAIPDDPPLPSTVPPDVLPDAVRFWLTKAEQASAANDPAAAWLYRLHAAELDANPERAASNRLALHLHRQASPALDGTGSAVATTPLLQPEKNMMYRSYFSPNGRWAALHNTEPLYAYDLHTGRLLGKPAEVYPNNSAHPSVLWTPDGRQMIAMTFDQNEKEVLAVLQVYDTKTGQEVGKPMKAGYPLDRFGSVFVYPRITDNGRYVQLEMDDSARMGYDGGMATPRLMSRAFDLHTGAELTFPRKHNRVALSPCGRYALAAWSAAVGAGRSINGAAVYDLRTGQQHGANLQIPDEFYELQLSRNGEVALVVDWRSSNMVRCYQVADGRCLIAWKPFAHLAHAALSPDGRFVAAIARTSDWNNATTGELHVRSTATGQRVGRAITLYHAVDRFDFSPDGRWLLLTSGHEQFLVDVSTGERISPHLSMSFTEASEPFAVHPDATLTNDRLLVRRPIASQHGAMFGEYEFTPETMSFADARQRAELVAGRRLSTEGALEAIPLAEYQARWQKAVREHPEWFATKTPPLPTTVPVPPTPLKRRPTPPARVFPKADYDAILARHQRSSEGVWLRVAEALRHERPDVRWAAIQYTLAKQGFDPLVIDLLAEAIRTGLAEMAYPLLLKNVAHAKPLLPALRAELQAGYDDSCRQAAIDELNYRPTLSKEGTILLGRMGAAAKDAVPLLVAYLAQIPAQQYSDVEREAIRTLGRIGPEAHTAVPVLLVKLGKHTRTDQLSRIVLDRALDRIIAGQEATFAEKIRNTFPSVKATRNHDWQNQRRENHTVGLTQLILRHPTKFAELAPTLRVKLEESTPVKNQEPNPQLRSLLAEALWRTTGDATEALPILKAELTRPGGSIAHTALAIAHLGKAAESLLPEVQAAYEKATNPLDRLAIAEALWRLKGDHTHALKEAFTLLATTGPPRLRAIALLGELGPLAKDAVPKLVELVKAEDAVNAKKTLRTRVIPSNDPDDLDYIEPNQDSILRDTILPVLRKIDPTAAMGLKPKE